MSFNNRGRALAPAASTSGELEQDTLQLERELMKLREARAKLAALSSASHGSSHWSNARIEKGPLRSAGRAAISSTATALGPPPPLNRAATSSNTATASYSSTTAAALPSSSSFTTRTTMHPLPSSSNAAAAAPVALSPPFPAWSVGHVSRWLSAVVGLEQYVHVFNANEINGQVLAEMSSEDLDYMGVNILAHRKVLLKAIDSLRLQAGMGPLPQASIGSGQAAPLHSTSTMTPTATLAGAASTTAAATSSSSSSSSSSSGNHAAQSANFGRRASASTLSIAASTPAATLSEEERERGGTHLSSHHSAVAAEVATAQHGSTSNSASNLTHWSTLPPLNPGLSASASASSSLPPPSSTRRNNTAAAAAVDLDSFDPFASLSGAFGSGGNSAATEETSAPYSNPLFEGNYDEEAEAASFQQAVLAWRKARRKEDAGAGGEDAGNNKDGESADSSNSSSSSSSSSTATTTVNEVWVNPFWSSSTSSTSTASNAEAEKKEAQPSSSDGSSSVTASGIKSGIESSYPSSSQSSSSSSSPSAPLAIVNPLSVGTYDEEAERKSFQEALLAWRSETAAARDAATARANLVTFNTDSETLPDDAAFPPLASKRVGCYHCLRKFTVTAETSALSPPGSKHPFCSADCLTAAREAPASHQREVSAAMKEEEAAKETWEIERAQVLERQAHAKLLLEAKASASDSDYSDEDEGLGEGEGSSSTAAHGSEGMTTQKQQKNKSNKMKHLPINLEELMAAAASTAAAALQGRSTNTNGIRLDGLKYEDVAVAAAAAAATAAKKD